MTLGTVGRNLLDISLCSVESTVKICNSRPQKEERGGGRVCIMEFFLKE